jgi:D-serine deaminase-like pyridoxal phosphate-dependent protein
MEKNIKTMADYYRLKGGALRPHQKGHRLPIIARKQIASGARGVSMTSLGLAELYVESGIDDILITAEICGRNKLTRLCSLSKHGNVTVTVDEMNNARQLSEAALANNVSINVAVELFMGRGSAGVLLENAKSFVKELVKVRGLNFRGFWWHEVFSIACKQSFELRRKENFGTLDAIAVLKDEIEDMGITIEMLSGGYTYTWNITPEYPKLREVEVQAGNYVFSDWCTKLVDGASVFDCALTVLTRCISRPRPNEAIFDFGMNSCSDECGYDYREVVGPRFKDVHGITEVRQREEVSLAVFKEANRQVKVGDIFEVIPPHADTTAKLHDRYYGMRNDKVEAIWPNYGRGLL